MLDKEDLNYINGVIDSLQRMTSGNVAHLRSGCIGALRSLIDLNELRVEHKNFESNKQEIDMKIKNIFKGKCSECNEHATKSLDNILYCSRCADSKLIQQIGQCIKAIEHAKVTIKVVPIKALEASHGDKKCL